MKYFSEYEAFGDDVDIIEKLKLRPSAVIVLELSDEEVSDRLKKRLIDPVSGNIYEDKG